MCPMSFTKIMQKLSPSKEVMYSKPHKIYAGEGLIIQLVQQYPHLPNGKLQKNATCKQELEYFYNVPHNSCSLIFSKYQA